MTVAVLGAGGGGLAATVELVHAGHDVVLWNRNPATLAPHVDSGRIAHQGVLGDGHVEPVSITTDLAAAVGAAEVVVVCLPSVAHGALFADLAEIRCTKPVVLNPGHTGAGLHARQVFAVVGTPLPPIVEFSTLTYVARVDAAGLVSITGRAGGVRAAYLPGGAEALEWGSRLFPGARSVPDVLASSLSNVNLVLHPPGAVLGAAWVEATGGAFTFYVDGMTPGVVSVLRRLDDERRTVAAAFGHRLPSLVEEMVVIGTAADDADPDDVGAAIRGGTANRAIPAPDSLSHRYYQEDLAFGLLPFVTIAQTAGVPVPTAAALLHLGRTVVGEEAFATGLDADRLGIGGMGREEVFRLVDVG